MTKTKEQIRDEMSDKFVERYRGDFYEYYDDNLKDAFCAGFACRDELDNEALKIAVQALDFYANKDNWEYTDGAGQYSWFTKIKNDCPADKSIGEEGGFDYAGDMARKTILKIKTLLGDL